MWSIRGQTVAATRLVLKASLNGEKMANVEQSRGAGGQWSAPLAFPT
jgi:hypothetical protein